MFYPSLARSERGTALLEFAMVAPLFGLLIAGMVDLSFMFREKAVLMEATQAALRVVAVVDLPGRSDTSFDAATEETLARARYQEAIEAARMIVSGNGLSADNYRYQMSTVAFPDGSQAAQIQVTALNTGARFVILPKGFTASALNVTGASVLFSSFGPVGTSVIYDSPSTYCS